MKKKKKQTAGRKWILQLFLLLGISLLAGVLFEGLYEMNTYRRSLKGGHQAEKEQIEKQYIKLSEPEAGVNENGAEEGFYRIKIIFPERYINKFQYSYTAREDFVPIIKIHTKDIYKNSEVNPGCMQKESGRIRGESERLCYRDRNKSTSGSTSV